MYNLFQSHCLQHTLNYSQVYISHQTHKERCAYSLMNCPNEECQTIILRKDVEKHQAHCDFRLVVCHHCPVEVQFNQLKVFCMTMFLSLSNFITQVDFIKVVSNSSSFSISSSFFEN